MHGAPTNASTLTSAAAARNWAAAHGVGLANSHDAPMSDGDFFEDATALKDDLLCEYEKKVKQDPNFSYERTEVWVIMEVEIIQVPLEIGEGTNTDWKF